MPALARGIPLECVREESGFRTRPADVRTYRHRLGEPPEFLRYVESSWRVAENSPQTIAIGFRQTDLSVCLYEHRLEIFHVVMVVDDREH